MTLLLNQRPLPTRFVLSAEARRRFGARLDPLGPLLYQTDPLADAVVETFAQLAPGAGFRLLERGLRIGIDSLPEAPPALRELLRSVESGSARVDWPALDRGGAVFLRSGVLGSFALGLRSILRGYASPGGNKPLAFSGRLLEKAGRRLMETARFVQAVSQPGGMRAGRSGYVISVKVRVMHAEVRRLIYRSQRWRDDLWGAPINQHDSLMTILLFSVALIEGLERLGYKVSFDEREDVLCLWRHVARILGVDELILPHSFDQGRELDHMITATQGPPDDDARALTAAYLGFRLRRATTQVGRYAAAYQAQLHAAVARILLGDELADGLGIQTNHQGLVGEILRPVAGTLARVNRLPLLRDLAARAGSAYWDAVIRLAIGGKPIPYSPPEALGGLTKRPPTPASPHGQERSP